MLYAFIEKIEVHAPTGGRTVYRQQRIDIHFNFIGNYVPPVAEASEEERIAAIARLSASFALNAANCSAASGSVLALATNSERISF